VARGTTDVGKTPDPEQIQSALYRIAELASAAQDMEEFYRAIHEVVGELMYGRNFFIALYDEDRQLMNWPYFIDEVDDDLPDPGQWVPFGSRDSRGTAGYVLRTGEPQLFDYERWAELVERGEIEALGVTVEDSSWLGVPLKAEERTIGVLVVQSYTSEHQYTEQDKDLLAFVGQHVGAALSRARAIEETRQRNAELALINSVQDALAGELEMQAIYDVVGDKLQEVFDAQHVSIFTLDEASGLMHIPYMIERGERLEPGPLAPAGFSKHVLETRESLLITENLDVESKRYGSPTVAGEDPKSVLFVPLIAAGKATGAISLQNVDREHAFDGDDQRLLTTLAGSLSVALENARLVHETRQRNAELALINSVQGAFAGELEMQAIYDVVGDKIQEIFDAQVVDIAIYDESSGLIQFPYVIERGERLYDEPIEVIGLRKHIMETREPLLINENALEAAERYGNPLVLSGDPPKSWLGVPLVSGGKATGVISLQNVDREHAFTDADQRLLMTLAGSLSVALENARLVHETRQRNAELAVINSVQDAVAGELDQQAIYDAVGERIQEIFDAQAAMIFVLDEATGRILVPYSIERGERLQWEPMPPTGFSGYVLETREPLLINEDVDGERARMGIEALITGEPPKSVLYVPLFSSGRATGLISLQNVDREHAFEASDQQLLETLAGSLSVALENARLVHETRQRNAELALINSVQEALAGELEMQAIYDVVGDKIREIFDSQVVDIGIFDFAAGLTRYPYTIERGVRFPDEPTPITRSPTTRELFETKAPVLINDVPARDRERGEASPVVQGEPPLSVLVVPLGSGDDIRGRISLQNLDRTNAFSENDVRLLTTLAGSLSVALENARLVHETRQRNAELALINSVQEAIAGELDQQAIYDAVGDKIQEIFDAQGVSINVVDETTGLLHFPYLIERGERLWPEPMPLTSGFTKHVLETREPLLINEDLLTEVERYGSALVAGEMEKSALFVPLITGGRANGAITLSNFDREHAFSESDQQLLETLAGSLSVALENARLVHETRQRNAELALINSVQEAIAGELEPQAIYDAVGDRIRDVFDAQTVFISTLDEVTGLLRYPYIIERGQRLHEDPGPASGFSKHVLETREPLLLTENLELESERFGSAIIGGGELPKSALFVPLVSAGKATGVVSLQNVDREHAFGEDDQQLLATLAGSLSVALENARLVHETRQRNAELALINSVQDSIAGELDQQAIFDLVGEKLREVFDAQAVDIAVLDENVGILRFVYQIERGVQFPNVTLPVVGFRKHVMETRQPLAILENMDAALIEYDNPQAVTGEPSHGSAIFQPLVVGGRSTGVISIHDLDHEHAFDESDRRLLATIAGSLGVALDNAQLVDETRQRNAELALINSVQEAIAGELDPQAIYDAVGDKIRDVFDAQVVNIVTLDEETGLVHYPYMIERGERLQAEPREPRGFSGHVLETREPLLIVENVDVERERYGGGVIAGEPAKSVLFVPLVTGGKAAGVISLQNIDREHAFDQDDQRLLTTLAGSLIVALENARLVDETRQRVAELATVNSVGQALASQLELDALIELVGERVRETFEADIAYVALHNEATGQIDFPYYHESGERRAETPLEYGEGLTSQILRSREPLLLNRREQVEEQDASVGTPSLSYLGVPILVGSRSIGVISVQSIDEEGRFGEADSRLLATIAANVGVAIQNARLFSEVEHQREYSASLIEISPAAVVVMDPDEVVTEWNPAAAALFGYSSEEAVDRRIDDLVFADADREEGREITREALSTGRAQRIARRMRKDGTPLDVELLLVPLYVEGRHAGFVGIYHDITELQRAREEAEAATQAKSAFLATMSHEIRTPMNAVIGMTDLLLGTDLTDEQREFAQVVRSSGDALLHVIDDILDYSKIEAGKLELEREPVDLRECVEGALEIVAPRAWEKELELGCLIDEDTPAGIVGDGARLRQVLLNLLSNAVKFTEDGEVVVLVHAQAGAGVAYDLRLEVRDTGIGIPADRMDKLFTSFSQVDASTTRRFGGTGLGLAISKRLVDLMGGAISVESEQGKGSTFRISLPVDAAEVPAKIALDDGLPQLAGKRILVVDDNATNREIASRLARSWGIEAVAVELPSEALDLIGAGEQFDAAVLDMMMPEMDGIALANEIRKQRAESELPLVLLTSLGRLPQARTAEVFAVQLSKPVRASQLYNALVRAIGKGAETREAVEAMTESSAASSALRILLAEDNAVNQKVALRLLERLGYTADVAWNGLEALEALEQRPYDVVLMDVQMPELDGLDASRRICERWPAETRPRIIAMTANAMPEDREACLAAGMDDYVAKPIRPEELAKALGRVQPRHGNGDAGTSSDAGSGAVLDASALDSLRELGGDDFVAEVLDTFLTEAPGLVATLRTALDANDADELRRAAHSLKSNGATFGANTFAELCRELEQRAKSGELDGAAELIDRIEREYEALARTLAGHLPEPAA
jgi:PAS domain S-box-containing protein